MTFALIFLDADYLEIARRLMEEAVQADDDDDTYADDGRLLNMNEEDGTNQSQFLYFSLSWCRFESLEDVWDEDSAYIEMLANEVSPFQRLLLTSIADYVGVLPRVLVYGRNLRRRLQVALMKRATRSTTLKMISRRSSATSAHSTTLTLTSLSRVP